MRKLRVLAASAALAGMLGVSGLPGAPTLTAWADDTICNGLLTGAHDNVLAPQGADCIVFSATLKGNFKGDKAARVWILDSEVGGGIDIVETRGADPIDVAICGTAVRGNVQLQKNHGRIWVGHDEGGCPGNDVQGNLPVVC
jgi:hypothetical protein